MVAWLQWQSLLLTTSFFTVSLPLEVLLLKELDKEWRLDVAWRSALDSSGRSTTHWSVFPSPNQSTRELNQAKDKLLIHHQGDHRSALPHLRSPPHPPPHLRANAAPDVRQHSGQLSVKWNLRYICLVWFGLVNFPSGSIWPAAIGNPAQPACGRRSLGRHAPAPAALAPLRTTHSRKNAILEFIGRNGFRKIIFCLKRQNLLQQYLGIQK